MSSTSNAMPPVAAGLWTTVLAGEWRLVRRDPAAWIAALIALLCTVAALAAGAARATEREAAVAAARQDEQRRLAALTEQLRRIERGEAAVPAQPWRDPTNAMTVGRGRAATVAAFGTAPLAATAVGLADLVPPQLRVQTGSRDRFLFADEIANPMHLATGSFDLAFVVVVLLPLLLLALGHDVLSGERERGTWALHEASSAPALPILVGKLAVRCAPAVLAVVLAAPAGLLLLGAPLADAGFEAATSLAAWIVAVLLYAGFWLALVLAVNGLRRSSSFNALALVLGWALLVLVLPAAINAVAQAVHPAPSRSEMVQAVRESAIDAERDREAEQARFRADHGLPADARAAGSAAAAESRQAREARALRLVLEADRRANETLARHESMVRRQRDWTDTLALVSPPMLMQGALAELAGHGHARTDAFLAAVGAFHADWQRFFVDIAQSGARLRAADIERLPRFDAHPGAKPSTWAADALARVARALAVLAVLMAALGIACRVALQRRD